MIDIRDLINKEPKVYNKEVAAIKRLILSEYENNVDDLIKEELLKILVIIIEKWGL